MKKGILTIILFLSFLIFPKSVLATNAVAQINDKEYESLIDAIEAVTPNETITLLQDVSFADSLEEYYVAEIPDGVTIDLNKKDLTIGWDEANHIGNFIFTGTNIVIKNGTISGRPDYVLWIGDEAETNNVTISNVTVNGGINVYNATNVILNNLIVEGHNYYAVWADNGAQITIKSGVYRTIGSNGLLGVTSNHYLENALLIEGGKFITNDEKLYCSSTPLEALVIKAGIFNTEVKDLLKKDLESKMLDDFYVVGKKDTNASLSANEIDFEKEIQEVIMGNLDLDNTYRIILETIHENGEINIADKKTKIAINIAKTNDKDNINDQVKTKLKEKGEIAKIYQYFDIAINVMDLDSNQSLGQITKLKDKITFQLALPKEMQKENRIYYIVRKHNDEIEILDTTLSEDKNSLEFETDRFSTYALAYIENIENPNTYDGIVYYMIGMIISFAGLITLFIKNKREN